MRSPGEGQTSITGLPSGSIMTTSGQSVTFNIGANQFVVPVGSLTGSTSFVFNDWQTSQRIDYNFNTNHQLYGRYIYQDSDTVGTGQASPPGNTQNSVSRAQGL